jgi:FkbH-like protein
MKDFTQLKKNLKKDFASLSKVKIALLGDSSTQFLAQALRGVGVEMGFNFDLWEADFNQIEQQVQDISSDLFKFQPAIIVVFKSSHVLLKKYNLLDSVKQASLATCELESIKSIYTSLNNYLNARVIFYNYTEIDDAVFGSYANKIETSFLFQLRKLNYMLMVYSSQATNLYLCDISAIQNQVGRNVFFQSSIYINTEMVLSIDVLPIVASRTVDIISTLNGKSKKCVIIDLDNTTWGGIIGDDGLENIQLGALGVGKAFTEFQHWIKKLKERGIIVAVCSKNTESVAKEPFEKHPDMVLHLEDIAVFIANWENKVDNIRRIQNVLNIGFDTMVFLDDNPFERNLVRENISGITVPELPEDPAQYLEFLYSLNLFETISFSNEDVERTKLYQVEAQRIIAQQKFLNEDEFLQSLNMLSVVEKFNKFNTPRVAQLSQRSNQFNLRTVRYTVSDIERMAESADYFTFAFTLEDKFGDNGLICVVILHKESDHTLFIDTWLMSCRVLKRGMENFVLNTIVAAAKTSGFAVLKGEYIETSKNEIVREHYSVLGFEKDSQYWRFDLLSYKERKNYISRKQL